MGEAMKKMDAHIRRLQVWFLSPDKAFEMKAVYYLLCLALAPMAYFAIDASAAGYGFEDSYVKLPVMGMLLVVAVLMVYFCTHFIIFKINLAEQRKREKKKRNAPPAPQEPQPEDANDKD